MKMLAGKRALDKIYKRRDRYEIPDWQREEVWSSQKKEELIDTILRGWKLPKFYFLRTSDDPEEFEVVDGQQRLSAIFEFLGNEFQLGNNGDVSSQNKYYRELPPNVSDNIDDFEIEYDEITEASEEDIKLFFQRLRQGLPLTSSEKLNAVHSSLRNFCRELARHGFFQKCVKFSDKRYAYFDVATKVAAIQIEGLETGLRFEDIKAIFESQVNFSKRSAVAKRLEKTLDYLYKAFPEKSPELRTRSLVQSFCTLASFIVRNEGAEGTERKFYSAIQWFINELSAQVELGFEATDPDYLEFQRSTNANVRGAAKTRHAILLRKLLLREPAFIGILDPSALAQSGISGGIQDRAKEIGRIVADLKTKYSGIHGVDLIKATNKTVADIQNIAIVIHDYPGYGEFIGN